MAYSRHVQAIRKSFALALISIIAFAAYRRGLISFPKGDELVLYSEGSFFQDSTSWFVHLLSYSRSRINYPGDAYLFRPLLMAVLGAIDIFIPRYEVQIVGAVSVGMLCFAAYAMYLFGRDLVGDVTALLAAMCVIAEFPGNRIVTYHHVSPYLLSLGFLALGLRQLLRDRQHQRGFSWRPPAFFLAASLFHEFVALSMAISVLVLAVAGFFGLGSNRCEESRRKMRNILLTMLSTLAAFLVLDGLDAAIHSVAVAALGPADKPPTSLANWQNPLTVPGALLVASVVPWSVQFLSPATPDVGSADSWANLFDPGLMLIYRLSAVAFYAGAVIILAKASKALRQGKTQLAPAAIVITGALLAVAIGFGLGRGALRGDDYIRGATWYIAISQYLFLLLLLCGIGANRGSLALRIEPRTGIRIGATFLGMLFAANAYLLNAYLDRDWNQRRAAMTAIRTLASELRVRSKSECLADYDISSGPLLEKKMLFKVQYLTLFFRDFACTKGDSRRPSRVTLRDDQVILVTARSSSN